MPDDLEGSIERWYARMERELRGLQEQGDEESLRFLLDRLQKNVAALMSRYEPPPPPPEPPAPSDTDRLVEALKRSRSRTFGSNF